MERQRPLVSRLREIVNDQEYYIHARNTTNLDVVLKHIKESSQELEKLQKVYLQQLEEIRTLKKENQELEWQLLKERNRKADRSIQEKTLVTLLQRARALLGPLGYAGMYNLLSLDKAKIRSWFIDLSKFFEAEGYSHKEEDTP